MMKAWLLTACVFLGIVTRGNLHFLFHPRKEGKMAAAGIMSHIPGQPVTAVVLRIEIHKLYQGENLILGFSIGGGIDQDPTQNPFSEDKTDKGIYVTRVAKGGPAEVAGLQVGDKIMQVNGWDMTMATHKQARKRLTKWKEKVVRLLVTRPSLQKAVQQWVKQWVQTKI